MKKYLVYSLLMVCTLLLAGCGQQPSASQSAVWVKCDTVSDASSPEVFRFPARVKASEEVRLAFKVSGTLTRIYVGEGQTVRRGDLLAQLDPRDYELQLQAVEGEYMSVKSAAERVFALYADSVATLADYDKARYGLQQITAKYEHARHQLADTRLCAPFDGTLTGRLFDAPAVVGAGMPVLTLLSSAMPEVEIEVPASIIRRQSEIVGMHVSFDYMPAPVPLSLLTLTPRANASQLYPVRLALPSGLSDPPAVGMSAMVYLTMQSSCPSSVVIPSSAVFHEGESDYVWICDGARVVRRRVELARLHPDGTVTVTSGLRVGEVIVTAGVHSLDDNRQVQVLPAESRTNVGGLL